MNWPGTLFRPVMRVFEHVDVPELNRHKLIPGAAHKLSESSSVLVGVLLPPQATLTLRL